ncbi:MAG: flagellar regulator YcgR PilZN domain-containing protein [Gallionellaceae bacterium]|jgi:c-di-GMP-binding flagellar brake protein YcgR
MSYHKDVALKIEHFYNDEDIELRIKSKTEMLSILHAIAEHGAHVALYYGGDKNFILTTLLDVNAQGMWLEVGPFSPENTQILLSDEFAFVSVHRHVKIQFVAHRIKKDSFENNEAFYMELPDYLLRLQRRDYFRTSIPASSPVKCIITIQPEKTGDDAIIRAVPLVDISGGGIGLLCEEDENTLLPDKTFSDCQIAIPDIGILTVSIEVRNVIIFTDLNNVIHKHVGCRFIHLDNQMAIQLQSYVTLLQRERLLLDASNDR